MTHNEIRQKYLEFFKKRGHKEIPSASLVPENDPTSLFTSSGMQPLINYLLGEKHPLGTRLVNSQKCFRSQDIEEIGDNRHTTFFEMLGNWSLGDYFKNEQLPWIFEFLTKELGLDPKRLYVTVFEGNKSVPQDKESISIWKEIFAGYRIDAKEGERIFTYPAAKNWWSRSGEPEKMPPGEPGGPDSEVFFDLGEELGIHQKSIYKDQKCHPNCDCGRFLEIANSVFMQYQKQADGTLKELPNKNVDFGGGLERLIAAVNNNPDIFRTDIFNDLRENMTKSVKLVMNDVRESRIRIFLDHSRTAIFLISEGLTPGKNEREYVLRRLIRRADDQLKLLELDSESFWKKAISHFKDIYKHVYSDSWNQNSIFAVLANELRSYGTVLRSVEKEKSELMSIKNTTTPLSTASAVAGPVVFGYQSSHGIPYIISEGIIKEVGLISEIVKENYQKEMEKHKELSRTASKGMFKGGLQDQSEATTKLHTATHLLQQALRSVLGDHVRQKGSHITAERLRFDFSHSDKMTQDEIKKVESLVNEKIKENLVVSMKIVGINEAIKEGALTVPGTQYPEKVKVYSVGNFSKEVCGGPHVDFTGRLGKFKIIKEEAVGTSVRRIYAILTS